MIIVTAIKAFPNSEHFIFSSWAIPLSNEQFFKILKSSSKRSLQLPICEPFKELFKILKKVLTGIDQVNEMNSSNFLETLLVPRF